MVVVVAVVLVVVGGRGAWAEYKNVVVVGPDLTAYRSIAALKGFTLAADSLLFCFDSRSLDVGGKR